ncbi:hypothetical protein IPC1075_15055 [Pseudomonas aeruginosa]|nr:hypothetical protein IPC1075_15055 [Pseudomonas aeruginosa]
MKHRRTQSRMSVLRRLAAVLGLGACALAAEAAEPLKIGFVYVGPVGDHGWTYQHELGRRELVEHFGDKVKTSFVENVAEGADAERVIRNLAKDGYGLVFTTSFGYMNPTAKVARQFPKVTFEHATGYKRDRNLGTYLSRSYEGRYVGGFLAAKMTRSHKIGYIASFPIPEVIRDINAIQLALDKYDPQAELKVMWVSTWFDPGKEADAANALIDQACREWGFFYIAGHPLPAARFEALLAAAREFFALPVEEKLKIDITRSRNHRGYGAIATEQLDPALPSDFKETFDMALHLPAEHPDVRAGKSFYGPNRHPDLPGWEALLEGHYADMLTLARTVLRALAIALGIDEDFFDRRFEQPVSVFRLIHYPPASARQSADQPGAGAHTDYGCVTLLYQDAAGGLQVQNRQGEWIDAPPIDGTFVVNIGDMMARWSNDRYRSTPHRVISPRGVHRYSMPFFAEPHMDTEIRCLPGCFDADNPPKYPPTTCGDWLTSRFAQTYAYRRGETA